MKRIAIVPCLASLLGTAAAGWAAPCNLDLNPAATLLLPYFEVDTANPNGTDTIFAVNNALAEAVLTHVVLWSDLGVPVLDFNVYLTGYDMQTFDLRSILVNGELPQTASAGQDPTDTISPKGVLSQDINFASCQGILPPPQLPRTYRRYLQRVLTGRSSPLINGQCAGRNLGDRIARGYITVDTVNNCTLRFPGDAGYFGAGGTGDATDQNALFGNFTYIDQVRHAAEGFALVPIEASATDPATTTAGRYTFYGRFDSWNATDNREPLATTFGALYAQGTDLIVWRDPKVDQGPFPCPGASGVPTSWYPLGHAGTVVFDEEEHPNLPTAFPIGPPLGTVVPFPAAAQRVAVGSALFPVPFNSGWAYLNLNTTVTASATNPPFDPASAQAWVIYVASSQGGFATGYEAMRYDTACQANHSVP
jgi:hypothetical protein